tara:strand:+ start:3185 stop:3481 length:297 start_codon:yes stop_codon:yes gene_type:complete
MSWIVIFFILSLGINVLLIWYIRKMLTKLLYISDSIGGLLMSAKSFSNHLNGLYELETFYGDETLGMLIKHSKQVIEDIEEFEDIYTLANDGLEKDEE